VLAYRVPGERAYLDGRGRPVALPPDGDRAAAPVERDGRELGMLVYDASLDDDPELVGTVAAAAALTLGRRAPAGGVRGPARRAAASRERIVAAGDAERRGWSATSTTGPSSGSCPWRSSFASSRARSARTPALAEQLRSAGEELSQSLEELRELARGIHPAVLNHGLEAALDSLASRSSVATTVAFDSPERLPEPVELAAYFVACEALANVAKYAQATQARVRVSRRDGLAVIEIADDGIGGADETAGTGLQGLADRVAALDGTLRVLSPPGAGTVVTAELPCAS
jgi:signal transduction histidine kinase